MNRTELAVAVVLLGSGVAVSAEAQTFRTGAERVQMQESQAKQLLEYYETPRPIEAAEEVWISKLTWLEVRDALAAGKTTVIVPVGAVDQNGPFLVTNKHEVTLGQVCEGSARKLGHALCAPTVDFGRQGAIDPPSGQMRYSGVISVREETFAMLIDDIASSLRQHGFTDIIFITDKGTNEADLRSIAASLNERWQGVGAVAYYLDEQYTRRGRKDEAFLEESLGIVEPSDDGHHDNIVQTSLLLLADPDNVRYDQRAKAGLLSINGINIESQEWVREVAQKLLAWRIDNAVAAIENRLSERAAAR
ncbi:MAG: creatininase family protein [Vicinamibacteraceae bacterium]